MTTVRVSTANWVIARSGAPSSAYITATPYPTVPSDNAAAMLERANVADSAAATMSAASAASWNWIGAQRRGGGREPPLASATATSAIAVTTTVSTYERSDALWSAGARRRLAASSPSRANV